MSHRFSHLRNRLALYIGRLPKFQWQFLQKQYTSSVSLTKLQCILSFYHVMSCVLGKYMILKMFMVLLCLLLWARSLRNIWSKIICEKLLFASNQKSTVHTPLVLTRHLFCTLIERKQAKCVMIFKAVLHAGLLKYHDVCGSNAQKVLLRFGQTIAEYNISLQCSSASIMAAAHSASVQ